MKRLKQFGHLDDPDYDYYSDLEVESSTRKSNGSPIKEKKDDLY